MNNAAGSSSWSTILQNAGINVAHPEQAKQGEVLYPFSITYNRYKTVANIFAITERDYREGFAHGIIVDESTLASFILEV